MKKTLLLFLIFTMLCTLCIPVQAAPGTVKVVGKDYVASYPAPLPVSETGHVQLWAMNHAGFDVDLKYPATELELTFNTGNGYRGKMDIRLGSSTGEVLGSVDSTQLTGEWTDVTVLIPLAKPISGKVRLHVYGHNGCHWVQGFTLNQVDPNAPIRRFASLDASYAFTDIAEDANANRINLLADLGIIPTEDGQFLPERPITRMEFVDMVARAVTASKYSTGEMPFADVPKNAKEAEDLAGLYALGVIRGDTEGNFRPNSFITLEEAATVCTNALGYSFMSGANKNVLALANQLKLFRGVDMSDATITKSEGARLMHNLVTTDFLMPKEIWDGQVVYEPEMNFMEKNSPYYYGEGVITGNYDTDLYAPKKSSNFISIDGEKFKAGDTLAATHLGVLCEYFYTEESGVKTLAAIRPKTGVEVTTVRSGGDISFDTVSEREIVYSDAEEEYEFSLDASTAIIYNGVALDSSLAALVNAADFMGTITLIDNDKNGVCDCVWIDHARSVVVAGVRDGLIKDELSEDIINTEEGIFSLYIGGQDSKVKNLTKGRVLTMYESANSTGDKLVRVVADVSVVSGMVTEITNAGAAGEEIVIEGIAYAKDSACNKEIYPGLTADFYLNDYGKIVTYVKTQDGAPLVGAFLDVTTGGTSLTAKVTLKLLTQDGVKIVDAADKVMADGVTLDTPDKLYNGSGFFTGLSNLAQKTPVRYRLNENNELKMIDTVAQGTGGPDDCLAKLSDALTCYGVHHVLVNTSTWGTEIPYRTDVSFIKITNDNEEKNFGIVKGFPHTNDQNTVRVVPYTAKENSFVADILLAENYGPREEDKWKRPFIFEKTMEIVNEDGDKALCLTGSDTSGKVTYEVDMDAYSQDTELKQIISSVRNGDIIWPMVLNNKVAKLELTYLYDGAAQNSAGLAPAITTPDYASPPNKGGPGLSLQTVVSIEDGFVKLLPEKNAEAGVEKYAYHTLANLAVTTCEQVSDGRFIVSSGQPASSLFEGDKILVYGANYTIYGAFIYRGVAE